MSSSSTATAPNYEIGSCSSTTGPHGLSLDRLILCIENVLADIPDQSSGTKLRKGTELRDLVQPLASDFSNVFKAISDGAKMLSDQKNSKSGLSTAAHSMAVDVLKGLGNAHWVAVGLLAIATVLERIDKIYSNDRECRDLLRAMFKLARYLKRMTDLNVHLFYKEALEDIREAVHLILSVVIICRSFIRSNKIIKFLSARKVGDELVYLRGKVNSMKTDLHGHVELLTLKTVRGRRDETEVDGSESGNVSLPVSVQDPKFSLDPELQRLLKEIRPSQMEFKRKELEKATKGFSQKVGEGGSGSIYHGTLSNGRHVAVKRRNQNLGRSNNTWLNELKMSTKLIHPNILELVGFCCEEDLMLVYDYMPQDLDRIFWGKDVVEIMDWPTRYNIILDIIRGLIYLHKGANGGIVHRDIKPSNILLDGNLNAKICDFDLARKPQAGILEISHVEEIPIDGHDYIVMTQVATTLNGSLGYIDPEYLEKFRVTLKSDIYSFGVVLLNIVSGRRAIYSTEDIILLSEEARRLHKDDRLTELIDSRLMDPHGVTNSSTILRTIKIALCCIEKASERRPSAEQVFEMLSSQDEISIPTSPSSQLPESPHVLLKSVGKKL